LYVDAPGFRNPPWTVLLLLPFALLPTQLGAGLVRLLTVGGVMAASYTLARGRRGRVVGGLLALFSFPMLNALYRVQLVGFVILGAMLGHIALRRRSPLLLLAALLLVTVKPQISALLVVVWLWSALRYWPVHARWYVIACCVGWIIVVLVLFGVRWPLDWLTASRYWRQGNDVALVSSSWRASAGLGLPSWTPLLLALGLGLVGAPAVIRQRGQLPLTAGWAVALSMLVFPYQHPYDGLALLALALPACAEIATPLAVLVYLLSFSQMLYLLGLPEWTGALLPVATALILTGLCWWNRRSQIMGDKDEPA
jgi:hypothetical protein